MAQAVSDRTLATLTSLLAEIVDLRRAADLLEWDERVYMPPGGARAHGEMAATLRRLAHEKFTRDEVGRALETLEAELDDRDRDSDASRLVSVTSHDYEKATKVPAEFVAEHAHVTSAAQNAWLEARAGSDFDAFRPHLERIVALKRQYVGFFRLKAEATGTRTAEAPGAEHPYDVLLDDYEPGMKTADVRRIFETLRPRQVALIRAIADRPPIDDSCLKGPYSEQALWDFASEVITAFGFDWNRGRQDKSAHPFATGLGRDDVRITTRWVEGHPLSLLFGTLHETGHALYEQGVNAAWHRTLLEGGASLGVHESQSRLWENLVGRSRPFWSRFYPTLQARVPSQLGDVALDQFYRAVNKVAPSLIRVEADEATYNLHVMLRVEIELGLIEGTLEARDLPEIWNARMREYLGLTPPDDARGVLQDIHWSAGLFGYFATYTLGNLISAQLWDTFAQAHPARDEDIRRGDFSVLLQWLRENLHQHGRKYQPQELVERVTGRSIDAEPYLRYLETKYGDIYGLG
jgi:carboxypeptidase Taq